MHVRIHACVYMCMCRPIHMSVLIQSVRYTNGYTLSWWYTYIVVAALHGNCKYYVGSMVISVL